MSSNQEHETTFNEAVAFILKGNCLDCFHPECLARVDVVEHLRRVLAAEGESL